MQGSTQSWDQRTLAWPCGSSRHGAEYKAHSLYASECAFHSGGDADTGFGEGASRSGVDGSDDEFLTLVCTKCRQYTHTASQVL